MSEMTPGGGRNLVVAALVGAAVGAGVALLLAPCSGRETRDWLARRTREFKDRAAKELAKDPGASVPTFRI